MSPPKISIVVPCCNVEKYIGECLNSIIGQTLEDIEIICVNDGSSDNTLGVINEYAKKDERVVVIDKPNSGYGHTMNVGMDQARGKYIGIVESDDFILPTMMEDLYCVAEANYVDIVKSDYYTFTGGINNRSYRYNNTCHQHHYYGKVLNGKNCPALFRFEMNTWTGLYRKEFLENHHIRHNETPGASYQDNGFWFQTFCLAERIFFIEQAYYMYRHDNVASSINNPGKAFCPFVEYDWIRAILEEKNIFEQFRGEWLYKKLHNIMFTVSRVADNLKEPVLEKAHRDYMSYHHSGELKQEFFNNSEWRYIQSLIGDYSRILDKGRKKRKKILSINHNGVHVAITLLGIKIKYRSKKLMKKDYENQMQVLNNKMNIIHQMNYYRVK